MRRLTLMLLSWWALIQVALGANVSLNVSATKLQVGQSTTLEVVITGGQPQGTPTVMVPDSLTVDARERRQSYTQTPRGIQQTYSFGYVLTALEPGVYPIGPVTVGLVGEPAATTSTITVEVVERTTQRPKDDLAVVTRFLRDEIWEGEVVGYEAELTAGMPIQDVTWQLPDFEGLQRAPHGEEQRSRSTINDPDGDLIVLRAMLPLVATGTGDRTQPPARGRVVILTNRKGWPFGRSSRNVVGQRAPLTVKPLPKPPADFSGLVGSFEVHSVLGKPGPVQVGASVPWTVRVVGDGVLDGFDLTLPTIEGVQIYRDGDEVLGRTLDGRYIAQKTFKMVLVPTEGGTVKLPELPITVFDTQQAAYRTLKSEAVSLEVIGEGDEAQIQSFSVDGSATVAVAPIEVKGLYTYGFATTPPLAPLVPFGLAIVGFPGMLLLLIDAATGTRRWFRKRFVARRSTGPFGAQRLRDLPTEPSERYRVLDLALREQLAAKVGTTAGALDRDEALAQLERADDVRHAFQVLDEVRFAGAAAPPNLLELVQTALKVLR